MAVSLLLATAMAGMFPASAIAGANRPGLGPRPAAQLSQGLLGDVAFTSASSAWAVGQIGDITNDRTLIERWNGKSWTRVPSPSPAPRPDDLTGVAAVSAADAWAVGDTLGARGLGPLIEHWNGTAWKVVPSPALPKGGGFGAVAAFSASDAWAVGSANNGTVALEHWNGRAWTLAHSPALPRLGGLTDVAGTSASNIWAVGDSGRAQTRPLAIHWNGRAWASVPVPGAGAVLVNGVTVASRSSAWLVGARGKSPIIEHWNGRAWRQVSGAHEPTKTSLADVTATSPRNAWAVGNTTSPARNFGVFEHWNGRTWKGVPSASQIFDLYGVAAQSASNAFAVGLDANTSGGVVAHWNGTRWTVSSVG